MLTKLSSALFAIAIASACTLHAADHLDAPNVRGDGQVDLNDLYAFQSPSNANNTVLIMTVNPAAGVFSPTTFGTDVTYTFNIDNTGDAVADLSYSTTFAAPIGGTQAFTLTGPSTATGTTGLTSATSSGGMVTAGLFDDPFFFDLNGFNDSFNFTGDDFFAGLNVSAIVLEIPSTELGAQNIGVWATTERNGTQVDRVGRPAITTALIPNDPDKTAFNLADPVDDPMDFGGIIQARIEALNGGNTTHAMNTTDLLLPDVLTFDTASDMGFLNGRKLADDVIDAELTLLTNSSTPVSDGVDMNDAAFRDVFPYLAVANIPEPSTVVLLGLAGGAALVFRRRR